MKDGGLLVDHTVLELHRIESRSERQLESQKQVRNHGSHLFICHMPPRTSICSCIEIWSDKKLLDYKEKQRAKTEAQ